MENFDMRRKAADKARNAPGATESAERETSAAAVDEVSLTKVLSAAAEEAIKALESASVEVPHRPDFAPRRLGATAPHDCRIYAPDYRDDDPELAEEQPDVAKRQLGTEESIEAISMLHLAGLSVPSPESQ